MLCRFWHQKNSPLYISITSKCKFFPRNLSETVMKTSFSILLFYGGAHFKGCLHINDNDKQNPLKLLFKEVLNVSRVAILQVSPET